MLYFAAGEKAIYAVAVHPDLHRFIGSEVVIEAVGPCEIINADGSSDIADYMISGIGVPDWCYNDPEENNGVQISNLNLIGVRWFQLQKIDDITASQSTNYREEIEA